MSLKKTRAFLEYYAKAAKGVPAGSQAEEALEELTAIRDAAKTETQLEEENKAPSKAVRSARALWRKIAEES